MSPGLAVAAVAVARVAAAGATGADETRRLDPDVVKSLVGAGFARHFVPAGYGGTAGSFGELTRALATVGEECAAASWSASIAASLGRMAGFLPAEGCAEVWQEGPDALIVGSLAPLGKAVAAPGGWLLSGSWPSISVVDFSDWALVRAPVPGGDGRPALRVFVIPRSSYRVEDTWFNVGMRGTGSNTLVAEDVFVPQERTFADTDLFAGRSLPSTAPCHAVPLPAVNGLSFAAPALGAARGALTHWSAYATEKIRTAPAATGGPGLSRTHYAGALARSAGEIDAASLLLERAAEVADRGGEVTSLEAARNTRDASLAMELLVTAVNRIFGAAGTGGQSVTGPLQRFWRDVNAASSHVGLQFEPAASAYAAQLAEHPA
ncbi:acyl-CoA dehydrogenase family protein [Streptomyces sp. RKAG290]|uniref:acyl-CoA dehydrogenase family protein n=1 Tax=Streptomyces sp. RKAG290 TaxID=2888348 RepID=UPI0020339E6B|nr:acyl-CoA dehydrogenase family protein [Streptomyces sp. RKAG290]MCM2414290.1 hydrolase [Streptomyces sp. RKAG290]